MGGFACTQCKSLKNNLNLKDKNLITGESTTSTSTSTVFENNKKKQEEEEKEKEEEELSRFNCGWEIETGYAIASGLSVLELKRLLIITVGIFAELNVINFAGGLIPLIITIVSSSFGIPTSLATVFTIHKIRTRPCFPLLKNILKYLLSFISICVILNASIVATIFLYLKTTPESMSKLLNQSMNSYPDDNSQKIIIDEFQFTFQCCGHKSYIDWINFDWQKVDYASRDEMSSKFLISDEKLRRMAVPYSCCKIKSMRPCFHTDISMDNIYRNDDIRKSSINEHGCGNIISRIVLRSAVLSYSVSIFLILTQILVSFIVIKILKRRPFPSKCDPPFCDCKKRRRRFVDVSSMIINPLIKSALGSKTSTGVRKSRRATRIVNTDSKLWIGKKNRCCNRYSSSSSSSSSSPSPPPHPSSPLLPTVSSNSNSQSNKNSKKSRNNNINNKSKNRSIGLLSCGLSSYSASASAAGAAKILPSLHTEHRVPKKKKIVKKQK